MRFARVSWAIAFAVGFVVSACSEEGGVPVEIDRGLESAENGNGIGTPLGDMNDAQLIAYFTNVNATLKAAGRNLQVAQIEFFTIGRGRPNDGDPRGRIVRILQQPFRWVSGDPRRVAQGNDITYLIDDVTFGEPSSPASSASGAAAAIRAAMTTWDESSPFRKVDLVERPFPGGDVTILNAFPPPFCPPVETNFGNFTAADIVFAGFYPPECFGFGTLAFSVTFTFTGPDMNGDRYADTALNEVYFNDAWGNPTVGDIRALFPWTDGAPAPIPAIDVETVAFHESGHSLGVGHFGPPPGAVMNPVYDGPRRNPFAIDLAGMSTVWNRWPN